MTSETEASAVPGINISWRQLAGITGIAGIVLFVIGAVLQAETPMPGDTAAEVRQWYTDNDSAYLLGNVFIALGVILGLVPFFTYLRGVLAAAEGGDAVWSRVNYLGAVLFIVMGGIAGAVQGAIAADAAALEDSVVLALQYISWGIFTMVPLAIAPFFLGLGFVTLRTGVFGAWLGWLSLLLAALGVIAAFATLNLTEDGVLMILGYLTSLGLGIVVLVISATFLRRQS